MKAKKDELRLHWLLLGAFLANIGNSFVWPLTTVYVHNELHQSLTVSGIVLLLYSGTNVIGSYIGGTLFDRFNPQHLTLGMVVAEIVMMGLLMWQNGWPAYPILLPIVGFINGWLITMLNSYGTRIRSHDGRTVFNLIYFSNNFGMMIGTAAVGPLYEASHDHVGPLFAVTAVMYAFFFVLVWFCYRVPQISQHRKTSKATKVQLSWHNKLICWSFFIGIAIVWIAYSQWSSNMSVYMTEMGISLTLYSLLWTVNGFLIVVFQLIISWLNRYLTNPYRMIYFGLLTVAMSFAILLFAKQYYWFVIGISVLTLGEATAFPTMPAVINELTPNEEKGRYQGLFNGWSSVGKALSPLAGGLMISATSYKCLFLSCLLAVLLVFIAIVLICEGNRKKADRY
ncbi:MDR family MFS transporter [Limosilactobacillus sp.]|uniref:MDR family MFS transporter n=1 Tax=Limosilactobacillus sp. TaxID=2773925 RepID=UPI00345E3427